MLQKVASFAADSAQLAQVSLPPNFLVSSTLRVTPSTPPSCSDPLIGGLRLVMSMGSPAPAKASVRRYWYCLLKRWLDLFTAVVLLVFFLPLMFVIAVAVKLSSPGPVLFTQEREGLHGNRFRIFKFRTMFENRQDSTGLATVAFGDERVTSTGRFLRRTSLDELPQIWNILIGDMSLVGPRPHVPGMLVSGRRYDEIVPFYHYRHEVRPGLTGLAQAAGLRGPAAVGAGAVERIEHDAAYVQNLGLWLDVKIAIRTVRYEFMTGSGI